MTPILNDLYILQTHQILPIAAVTQISVPAILQTWHKKLSHPSYLNLKCFGHARGININKMKVSNDVLICKICLKAKQKYRPFYKI